MPTRHDAISRLSNARFLSLLSEVSPATRGELILARAEGDPAFFAARFLPAFTRHPFAPFHATLFEWHRRMGMASPGARRGLRFALAAPRGYAKTTIVSLILPLHDIVFRREPYIILVSATERQAAQRLRAIRHELESGGLSRVVPNVRAARRELEAPGVRVEAFGAGSEMRGISQSAWRPTKIILDDAESTASADSPRRREQLLDWFAEVAAHLGDSFTHMLAIGTVLHPKGLLASLLERPDFESMRLRAIESFPTESALWDEWRSILCDRSRPDRREDARSHFHAHRHAMESGSRVLWPAREDIEELMAQLHLLGRRAFHQEKQNTPLGPEDALFDPPRAMRGVLRGDELIVGRWQGEALAEVRRLRNATRAPRFGYLDSALGRSGTRGDFAAFATILAFEDGTLFAESLTCRRVPPTEQVASLFATHEERPFTRLGIEATAFQDLLLDAVEQERARRRRDRRRADLPVQGVLPRARKATRIAALEPLLANGTLVLSPGLDEEFWVELANHPRSDHDDALDALAGAVELARGDAAETGAPLRASARTGTRHRY